MAGASSALDFSLHPDFGILAQRGRRLFPQTHPAPPTARRIPFACSTSKPRSIAIWPITTPAQTHSSGLPIPIPSLLLQPEGTKR